VIKPLSGTLRAEVDDVIKALYPGLKAYQLIRGKADNPVETKLKSVANKSAVTVKMMEGIVDGKSLVAETKLELRPTGKGIEVIESVRKVGQTKSSMQYKFQLCKGGDVRAFQ